MGHKNRYAIYNIHLCSHNSNDLLLACWPRNSSVCNLLAGDVPSASARAHTQDAPKNQQRHVSQAACILGLDIQKRRSFLQSGVLRNLSIDLKNDPISVSMQQLYTLAFVKELSIHGVFSRKSSHGNIWHQLRIQSLKNQKINKGNNHANICNDINAHATGQQVPARRFHSQKHSVQRVPWQWKRAGWKYMLKYMLFLG